MKVTDLPGDCWYPKTGLYYRDFTDGWESHYVHRVTLYYRKQSLCYLDFDHGKFNTHRTVEWVVREMLTETNASIRRLTKAAAILRRLAKREDRG